MLCNADGLLTAGALCALRWALPRDLPELSGEHTLHMFTHPWLSSAIIPEARFTFSRFPFLMYIKF